MVGIKEVAEKAGVSVTTVSRVMNNRGYIGDKTRKKVEDAIKELDYSPNQIARTLLKNQSYLIGLIVPELSHPFFSELIHWIEEYASRKNYKIIICNSLQNAQKEADYLTMLRENRADGIIMCSHTLEIEEYKKINIPIVTFDRIISSSIPYVASDNYHGGELAAQHLIEKGCKNLLHISGPLEFDMLSNRRADAFQLTCSRHKVNWEVLEGANIEATYADNWRFIDENLKASLSNYDGIFCSNDLMAYTLVTYARHMDIQIPEELKVMGYDYHSFTRMLQEPKLTTIKQPIEHLGKSLSRTLIKQIESKDPDHNIQPTIYDIDLVIGNTT
ncbi:transcriptional regulator, LacI family [Pelagirhabdus alkalitolerans]|uniref:Transcriptional regulator, LacI family n=1 Tax=Pelagirhabdus alkalitolerans TaxID=1612202 RepID=A0A1G6GPM8_9BACI|nr:LacI family DNA-binding transcriptional regulator [Pelagirhabdus alkalitolerans]SDB83891.1 transcriptional regulator, LacI family [Pelagirhabdus alkalitolerans]